VLDLEHPAILSPAWDDEEHRNGFSFGSTHPPDASARANAGGLCFTNRPLEATRGVILSLWSPSRTRRIGMPVGPRVPQRGRRKALAINRSGSTNALSSTAFDGNAEPLPVPLTFSPISRTIAGTFRRTSVDGKRLTVWLVGCGGGCGIHRGGVLLVVCHWVLAANRQPHSRADDGQRVCRRRPVAVHENALQGVSKAGKTSARGTRSSRSHSTAC